MKRYDDPALPLARKISLIEPRQHYDRLRTNHHPMRDRELPWVRSEEEGGAQGDPPKYDQKIQEERQRIAERLAPELRSWRVMKSLIAKRSVIIDGHKTSVSLEDPFWTDMKKIAHAQQMTLSALVAEIDGTREPGDLSSAIRLLVFARRLRRKTNGGSKGAHPRRSAGLAGQGRLIPTSADRR